MPRHPFKLYSLQAFLHRDFLPLRTHGQTRVLVAARSKKDAFASFKEVLYPGAVSETQWKHSGTNPTPTHGRDVVLIAAGIVFYEAGRDYSNDYRPLPGQSYPETWSATDRRTCVCGHTAAQHGTEGIHVCRMPHEPCGCTGFVELDPHRGARRLATAHA
jgi:hypothetical protein